MKDMMLMMIMMIFETRRASFCSENAFRLTKLSDCRSNIDDQLKRWHLSQHIGFVQEHELILNRSGLPHDLSSEQLERQWICEKHRQDMNIHTISDSCPERTSVEAASHLYSCSGLPKGLFTWRWRTPGRWGNPPSRGRKIACVYVQHFIAVFLLSFLLMQSSRQRQLIAHATQQQNATVARLRRILRGINRRGRMWRSSCSNLGRLQM